MFKPTTPVAFPPVVWSISARQLLSRLDISAHGRANDVRDAFKKHSPSPGVAVISELVVAPAPKPACSMMRAWVASMWENEQRPFLMEGWVLPVSADPEDMKKTCSCRSFLCAPCEVSVHSRELFSRAPLSERASGLEKNATKGALVRPCAWISPLLERVANR